MEPDWGIVGIRLGLYLSLMLLAGIAAFPLYALTRDETESGLLAVRRPLMHLSGVAIVFSILGFAMLVSSMSGSSLSDIDLQSARSILFETPIGLAWLARMTALLALLFVLLAQRTLTKPSLFPVHLTALVALSSLVWAGHAGASDGNLGVAHKASDVVHMAAGAIWIGGIAAFLQLLTTQSEYPETDRLMIVRRALDNFSRPGTICVALIATTGVFNSLALVGVSNLAHLLENTYGRLLMLKVILVGVMLVLAANNRWRLTPDLGSSLTDGKTSDAVSALRRSLLLEMGAAILILALVAWLGTLDPGSYIVGS